MEETVYTQSEPEIVDTEICDTTFRDLQYYRQWASQLLEQGKELTQNFTEWQNEMNA